MNAAYKWMKADHYVFRLVQSVLGREASEDSRSVSEPSSMPPGPRVPRLLQTLAFVTAPEPFIEACRRRYGDVLTFSTVFEKRFVMVFDADQVTRVLQEPDHILSAAIANRPLSPI